MDNAKLATYLFLIFVLCLGVNLVFTKVVFDWEPTVGRRFFLLCLIWFLPVLGVAIVYKILDLGWFKRDAGYKSSGAVSAGLLEIDAIFNPGSKHQIEATEKTKLEVRKEGELYSGPDHFIDDK